MILLDLQGIRKGVLGTSVEELVVSDLVNLGFSVRCLEACRDSTKYEFSKHNV